MYELTHNGMFYNFGIPPKPKITQLIFLYTPQESTILSCHTSTDISWDHDMFSPSEQSVSPGHLGEWGWIAEYSDLGVHPGIFCRQW